MTIEMSLGVAAAKELIPEVKDLIAKAMEGGVIPEDSLDPTKIIAYKGFMELIKENIRGNKKLLVAVEMGLYSEEFHKKFEQNVKKDKREYIELLKEILPDEDIEIIKKKIFGRTVLETSKHKEKRDD